LRLASTKRAPRRAWTQQTCLLQANFGYRIQRIVAIGPCFRQIAGLEENTMPDTPRAHPATGSSCRCPCSPYS